MSWFRIHTDLIHNSKVQSLRPVDFKALINLWCMAKEGNGIIPVVDRVAFSLRCNRGSAEVTLNNLCAVGLIDRKEDGTFQPHDWEQHQYKSDVSTGRVKRFRETAVKRFMKQAEEVSGNVSSLYSVSDSDSESEKPEVRSDFPLEEIEQSWNRHKQYDKRYSKQFVISHLFSLKGFDWDRYRRNHRPYCDFWDVKGWPFCTLSFYAWIEAGMPEPPPEPERKGNSSSDVMMARLAERFGGAA